MSVASMNPDDLSGSHVKIGAPSHAGRNLGIALGVIALGGGMAFYQVRTSRSHAAAVAELEAFRAAYAETCEAPSWRGEAPAVMRDSFLKSSRLQETVAKQKAALAGGAAACEDVAKALRAADFPLPAPAPKIE